MNKTAIVPGSYDPITFGHLYVIEQALKAANKVIICIAQNAAKSNKFDVVEREELILQALFERADPADIKRIKIVSLPKNMFVASYAEKVSANFIFRGIRNVVDFEAEHANQLVNSLIAPDITTMFVMPPAHLTAVSSSMIKGIISLEGGEGIAAEYVPKCVVEALKKKFTL